MSPVLLIDGDQFVFKATAALEKEIRWDEENHVLYSNVEECWMNLSGMLSRIFTRFEATDHYLCFSSAPCFRLKIDSTYKGGRSTRKPLCYAALRERVEDKYTCKAFANLEADDVMGILATAPMSRKRPHIIVSQDKDMKTIPTQIWDGESLSTVSEAEADYNHLYQTLIGDTTDGFKGCPGVGPKKAEALLATPTWAVVKQAYEKMGLKESEAITQARLARILRWTDWDNEKKTPILWSPPSVPAA